MNLNLKGFALASGVIGGLAVFVITLVAAGRGVGQNLGHLSGIFPGYEVTYLGSLIGLAYGFVVGLIAGWLFAVIYNQFTPVKT